MLGRNFTARYGVNSPETSQQQHGRTDDPEDAARVFAGGRLGESDRHEGRDGDQRTRQARHGRRGIRIGCGLGLSQPDSIFTIIISSAMIASSTSRPSAMISEPSETRSEFQPVASIMIATAPSTSGTDIATTMPARRAQAHEAHDQHDRQRLQQRALEFPDGFADGRGLVGDPLEFDAIGQLGLDLVDGRCDGLAQVDDVAVPGDREREHQHLLTVVAHGVGRADPRSRDEWS